MSRRAQQSTQLVHQGYVNSSTTSGSRSYTTKTTYTVEPPASSVTSYAPSNVTGFRKTLAVPGLPGSTFFTDREHLIPNRRGAYDDDDNDRRGRSIHRSMTADYPPASGKTAIVRRDSVTGRELVRYDTASALGEVSMDWDEMGTVVPEDSVSQVSSNRKGGCRRGREAQPPVPEQYRCAPVREGMRTYDQHGGFYVVERRPGGC